jgi:acetylornithine/N-succinyldiaminopimelate aminotransferase
MLKYDTIKALDDDFIMKTYRRQPALFVQGAGCRLWDNRGREYLDFLAGIATCSLGHCHPAVVNAITRQAQQLTHTSNFLLTAPQAKLAERLCRLSGMDRVFFSNDGATANETAIKIAKKHGLQKRPDGDYEIVALQRGFHGRTLGAISATGQRKFQRPFEPLVPGFVFVEANDVDGLKKIVSHKTAAILVEPIQGESGVHELTTEYLQEARRLATEHGALLIFDEVQTGIGRTGTWFNFQQHNVTPDVMTLAKGLGGGVPIGACVARGAAAEVLEPGDHGSTLGGNPLACAVAFAVLDAIDHQKLLESVQKTGGYLRAALLSLGSPVASVRGKGLMLAAALDKPIAKDVVEKCFERGLIINAPDDSTLRFVPPLIVTEHFVDKAVSILAEVLGVEHRAVAQAVVSERPRALTDFLAIDDLTPQQSQDILTLASEMKVQRRESPKIIVPIEGRSVALVFEKPSLRTRVAFEAAIRELGGEAVFLGKSEIGMGSRESIRDVSKNLSRWCSAIVARLYWHKDILQMAEDSSVPVINALTEMEHPCQAFADMLTVQEQFKGEKVGITYVGDGNNVARSLAKLAVQLGYPFTICGPENFRMEEMDGVRQTTSLEDGLAGAKVVYTDVWISMGDEHEQEHRLKVFEPYQVNARVMQMAEKDAVFMHCLPAHRGYEVTDDVIDSEQSVVYDQAENRLHVQKAILSKILNA